MHGFLNRMRIPPSNFAATRMLDMDMGYLKEIPTPAFSTSHGRNPAPVDRMLIGSLSYHLQFLFTSPVVFSKQYERLLRQASKPFPA